MLISRRAALASATLAVMAAGVQANGLAVTGHAAAVPITFETPTIVDPVHTSGEPDIRIDPSGHVYASSPTGTGTQRSVWLNSPDGGHTFRLVSQGLLPVPPTSTVGLPGPQPGGGDTEIEFDHTGKQYFSDLFALSCLRVATTTDGGATTQQNAGGGCTTTDPGADRQWYLMYDPPASVTSTSPAKAAAPLLYMEYNHYVTSTGPGAGAWIKSSDGLNFTSASAVDHFGADGFPSIDQTTGDVFEATYGGGGIQLNIGVPTDAAGDLAFLDDATGNALGKGVITVAPSVANDAGDVANFVVSSMDSARNLYVSWVGRGSAPSSRQTYVAVASAASNWRTWSAPVQVSSAPSLVSVFPWVKAGAAGRADVVWYGSDISADPSSISNQKWNAFMSQVVFPTDSSGAVTGAAPAITQVTVSPHPSHYNSICLQGTGCVIAQGDRNLADFFEVNMDLTGAAEIVYNDTSNGLCQPGFSASSGLADHCGAAVITVARQASGPGLLGTNVTGTPNTPVSGISHGAGTAVYPVIGGTKINGMDVLDTNLSLTSSALTVTTHVLDISNPAATIQQLTTAGDAGTSLLQYVTRWQMGNTLYYAGAEVGPTPTPSTAQFFAGATQSVDLCSVSACTPHVTIYPETATGVAETGSVSCPATPSASTPCAITITVNPADVGNPTSTSLLEEVGSYSFTASHPQAGLTNAQAQADNVALEIGGICCFNFQAGPSTSLPEAPILPALLGFGAVGIAAGSFRRRRRAASA